jgi:hypothetical protein
MDEISRLVHDAHLGGALIRRVVLRCIYPTAISPCGVGGFCAAVLSPLNIYCSFSTTNSGELGLQQCLRLCDASNAAKGAGPALMEDVGFVGDCDHVRRYGFAINMQAASSLVSVPGFPGSERARQPSSSATEVCEPKSFLSAVEFLRGITDGAGYARLE